MKGNINDPESLIGENINEYQLEKIVGRGATGAVYLGRNLNDPNDEVAIKLLLLPMQLSKEERGEFHARFRREAQLLQQLHHPRILSLLAYGEDTDTGIPFMILPYMPRTLASRMEQGPLPFAEIARYTSQIAEALDYAHARDIVHRDIKPANILLDADDNIMLADFGIVKLFDMTRTTLTTTGQIIGTPEYMSPEQARGEVVGPTSDVYSLGVLVYQMVTGALPFQANSLVDLLLKLVQTTPPLPQIARQDLPQSASDVLMCALRKNKDGRFSHAGEFANAFADGIQGRSVPLPISLEIGEIPLAQVFQPVSTIQSPPTTISSKRLQRNIIGVVVTVVLIVASALGFAVFAKTGNMGNTGNNGGLGIGSQTQAATNTAIPTFTPVTPPTSTPVTPPTNTPVTPTTNTPVTPPTTIPVIPPAYTPVTPPTNTPVTPPTNTPVTPPTNTPVVVPTSTPSTAIRTSVGSVTQSSGFVSVSVSCNSNEILVGGGAHAEGILFSSYPIDQKTWVAEGSGLYVGQRVFAYAVCLTINTSMSVQIIQSQPGSMGYTNNAICPGGTKLTGGGYRVSPPPTPLFGNGGKFNLVIAGSIANNNLIDWGVYAAGQSNEQLTAYAVCAQNGPSNIVLYGNTGSVAPGAGADITASCPGSMIMTQGGGADVTAVSAQSMNISGLVPYQNGSTWDYNPSNFDDTITHTGEISLLCAQF